MSELLDKDGTKYLTSSLKAYMSNRLSILHPVGTVIASDEAIDPGLIYGGTWSQIPEGFYLKSTTTDVGKQTTRSTTHTVSDTYISSTTDTDSWGSGTAKDNGTTTVTTSSYGQSSPSPITWTPAAHNCYIYVRTK